MVAAGGMREPAYADAAVGRDGMSGDGTALRAGGEQHVATSHPKIRVAASAPRRLAGVRADLDELARCADGSAREIVTLLQRIVPEFAREMPRVEVRQRAAA